MESAKQNLTAYDLPGLDATIHGILLDVEGTTSAVAYVYDVMFPFAKQELDKFLSTEWNNESLLTVKEQIALDAGAISFAKWTAEADDAKQVLHDEVMRLMDNDIKAIGLKQLQGLIWDSGFRNGSLKAHVYEDVAPAFTRWKEASKELRIYSSGSIHAQKLFFGHSESGDLTHFLTGHYDTTTGPKREADSYRKIVTDWGHSANKILFLSDVTEELDAAQEAGLQTALVNRPGNAIPTQSAYPHPEIEDFNTLGF